MPMNTYRKVDGSYYDAFEPDEPGDKRLPLRPSEIHSWNGVQWVWERHSARHATPRASDAVPPDFTLADLAVLIHQGLARIEHQEMLHIATQTKLDEYARILAKHLEETKGVPELLSDMRAASRLSRAISRTVLPALLAFALIGAAVWSAVHGDWTPLKKIIGIHFGS